MHARARPGRISLRRKKQEMLFAMLWQQLRKAKRRKKISILRKGQREIINNIIIISENVCSAVCPCYREGILSCAVRFSFLRPPGKATRNVPEQRGKCDREGKEKVLSAFDEFFHT